MKFFVIFIALLKSLVSIFASECLDGTDNLIKIYDLYNNTSDIQFHDITIHAYDALLQPTCNEIHVPGYIKFGATDHPVHFIGKIEILEPLDYTKETLRLELTIEQNSFLVGQVCEMGESRNAFVPDEVCNLDLCSLMEDVCKLFQTKGSFGIDNLPNEYRNLISLNPVEIPQIEGEWKAEFEITQNGEKKAGVGIGSRSQDDWISLKLGTAVDIEQFEETEKKRTRNATIHKEEL